MAKYKTQDLTLKIYLILHQQKHTKSEILKKHKCLTNIIVVVINMQR